MIVGTQILQIDRILTVGRMGNIENNIFIVLRQFVNAHQDGCFRWQYPAALMQDFGCPEYGHAGLSAIHDLQVLYLDLEIAALQGIVGKVIADQCQAIVEEIEIRWLLRE